MAIIYVFFRRILHLLYVIREAIELILIVWPIEAFLRLWYFLDPRVHLRSSRIVSVSDGGRARQGDVYVVFVLYARSPLPTFTRNAFAALEKTPYNVIVVSNGEVSEGLRAELQGKCLKIIERKNIGRDFGAYKDGVLHVLEEHPDARRIVIMNDSVFFFGNALQSVFAALDGPHDFIGVTENHEFHYHVQSFMLSFGRDVITSRAFVDFWRLYRPISTRRWAIHQGELKLTRAITRAGFRPHILYQAAHLQTHLQRRSARTAIEATRWLPDDARADIFNDFLPILGDSYSLNAMSMVRAISSGVRRMQVSRRSDGGPLGELNVQASTLDHWNIGVFTNRVISSIAESNQMHRGGFLFIKYLGMPMLKRDIFYRELFSLEDIYEFLTERAEPLRDEMLGDLRRGGCGANHRGLMAILYRNGVI